MFVKLKTFLILLEFIGYCWICRITESTKKVNLLVFSPKKWLLEFCQMFFEYICLYVERPWPLFCKNENWISASKELTTMTYKIIPFKVSTTFLYEYLWQRKKLWKMDLYDSYTQTDETDMGCFLKTLICGCMYMDKKDNIFNKYIYIYTQYTYLLVSEI